MSRAFVREPDGDQVGDDLPELPVSPHPNYVTPGGLAALAARVADARARRGAAAKRGDLTGKLALAQMDREIRYLEARVKSAIPVDPATQPRDQVAFGATVEAAEPDGRVRTFRIVGEDEADPAAGLISWISPLARAAAGATVGDVVTWRRPAGEVDLEIVAVRYEEP
jgi:transcription elongation factor GreB